MKEETTANIQQARLLALYEVSSRLGASLDLAEVLNQVMDSIIQLTGAERGFLMLFDQVMGELQTVAARNINQQTIDGTSMEISRTVVRRAATTGKGIVTNNAQEDERFANLTSVAGYLLRSIMCAPLKVRGRTLGAVYVDNRYFSNVFDDDDLELLSAFANQAAIAIENARLFTQTDQALARRVEELSLFQHIDQQLNQSLDLDRVLSLALEWAIKLTKADGGSIGLLEEQEDGKPRSLRLLAYKGVEGSDEPKLVSPSHPVLAQVLRESRSVMKHNVSAEEAIDGTPSAMQLAVPVRRNGTITGLITLESRQSYTLDREDIAFVERLADRAGVAIKNARLYAAVQAANKAKSDFISIVTHELRIPMTSIKGYTDLISSGMAGSLNEQQKQFLEVVRRNLERMNDLIRDLSDINRIESGRMQFECKAFDIREVVNDVTESWREAIAAKQQTLTLDIEDTVPVIYADPTRVNQVLDNLVSNASKYTSDKGVITIQIGRNGKFVLISVIDNGIGISAENQEKLFTQFFRAEDKAVREQAGWGLGLSIVKKMVEAQGGEIRFKSKLGQGSAFTFTVPMANIENESPMDLH